MYRGQSRDKRTRVGSRGLCYDRFSIFNTFCISRVFRFICAIFFLVFSDHLLPRLFPLVLSVPLHIPPHMSCVYDPHTGGLPRVGYAPRRAATHSDLISLGYRRDGRLLRSPLGAQTETHRNALRLAPPPLGIREENHDTNLEFLGALC